MPQPHSTAVTPVAEAGRHFLLRPGMAFLNHGSYGACPAPVFDAYQRWQRTLEEQPVEFLGRRIRDLLADARESLGAYLGTHADNVVFVPNATHGMNIVARSFPLAPGDEILGTDHEYGAVERTWRFVCAQHGAAYRSQPIALPITSAEAVVAQLWQGVTAHTRAIVISHITSPTAITFPIAAICRRAAQEGIITIVDGAHAPGQVELRLDELGADFYMGNCHKWLCAPKGAGFLYARHERQAMLRPLVVSWGWESLNPGVSPFQDYFEWLGTDDPAAYLTVPAAIAFQREHDWAAVREGCHVLAREARERVGALTGLPHITPDAPEWYAQMCAMPLPEIQDDRASEIKRVLWEEHGVEVPITGWHGQHYVRVSIQAYNSTADVDRLLEGLRALIA